MKQLLCIHGTEEVIRVISKSIRIACSDLGIGDDKETGISIRGCTMKFDNVDGIEYYVEADTSYYYIIVVFTELNREVEIPIEKKMVGYITCHRR